MANDKARAQAIKQQKIKQYQLAVKNLKWFALAAMILTASILLFYFLDWAQVFYNPSNNTPPEPHFSGWSVSIAALTGKYSSMEEATFGQLYMFATDPSTGNLFGSPELCEAVGILSLIGVVVVIASVAVQLITFITGAHVLNVISIVLNLIISILLFAVFGMCNSIVYNFWVYYCVENPQCSLFAYAIIPAIIALGAIVLNVIPLIKYMLARNMLKSKRRA